VDEEIRFDVYSLTLGETLQIERASGQDILKLLATTSGQLLVAVYVQRLRSLGSAPDWQELINLPLLSTSSGRSRSTPANRSTKSSG
jgi:hypothetical protein